MNKNIISLLLIKVSLFVFSVSVNAQGLIHTDLQQVLNESSHNTQVKIIVDFNDRIDFHATKHKGKNNRGKLIHAVKTQAEKSQTEVIHFLEQNNIFTYKKLWLINSLAITVNVDMVPKIVAFVDVAVIREDKVITLNATTTNVPGTPELNIELVKAPVVWSRGFTGQGVVVGIIGSGVDVYHPDLAPRYRGGDNSWLDTTDPNSTIPFDADTVTYHGTGVMGIAVGGNQSGLNIGVAPGAKWIAAKIFSVDSNNKLISIESDRLAAFQWMLDPDGDPNTQDAPDIVNNSWNLSAVDLCDATYQDSINALKESDISVVFSAGNSGEKGLSSSLSPANNRNTISVGAVDNTMLIEPYSSRGPTPSAPIACTLAGPDDIYPNIVAPGNAILTADGSAAGTSPNPYTFQTGTSFAAPHITGALAILKSAFPNSSSDEREDALRVAAIDLGEGGNDTSYGWGFLDIDGAYQVLLNGGGLVTTVPYVKDHVNSILPDSTATPILVLTDALADARQDTTNKIDTTSVVVTSNPLNGIVNVDNITGVIRYTPTVGFIGTDSFTYTVSDTLGNISNTGIVDLTIAERVALPPVVITPQTPNNSSGGGGCTLQLNTQFDPIFPILILLTVVYFIRRQKKYNFYFS
ncbi:hypothetical protein MNBD_GAMMA22-2244 [hydrothermal vent metagenome]|uniref:Peptidase S8/S53 domain-containing protein n=1 Tax=hydrothermal vent metagenome TaxID=652676 RepID=A0A3B0ZUH7_9ZZZZ